MTSSAKQHIFFVDDEPGVRKAVGGTLEQNGWAVSCFASAGDCLKQFDFQKCDLLITDVKMPEMDGMELLTEVKRRAPWVPVLPVTGYGNVPRAARALKKGADDFVEKPLERKGLLSAVESALRRSPNDSLLGKSPTPAEMRILRLILDSKSEK